MSSTPTTRNRLAKQGTGDNPGTWGDVVNQQDLDLIDESLDGIESFAVAANVTLSSTNYASDQARNRVLKFTGAGGFNVTVPGVEKFYIVHNTCTATVTVKTASGTGAAVPPSQVSFVYCDGTDCFGATATGSSTFTTKIVAPATVAGSASLTLPHGTAPTSPVNGDFWTTSASGLKYQVNGVTLGPEKELISSGTASAVNAVDVSLTGLYREYEFLVTNLMPNTTGQSIGLRVSTDGGSTFAAGATEYSYFHHAFNSGGTAAATAVATTSAIVIGTDLVTSIAPTGNTARLSATIVNPVSTTLLKSIRYSHLFQDRTTLTSYNIEGVGRYNGTTLAVTHLRIYTTSGGIACNYALYGRR